MENGEKLRETGDDEGDSEDVGEDEEVVAEKDGCSDR